MTATAGVSQNLHNWGLGRGINVTDQQAAKEDLEKMCRGRT